MSELVSPLCFGAVTFYSADAERCRGCQTFQGCGERVQKNITEISRVIDVETLLKRHREAKAKMQAKKLKPDSGGLKTQAPSVERNTEVASLVVTADKDTLKAEVRSATKTIFEAVLGVGRIDELRADLAAGKNPFPHSMKDHWLIGELLLRGQATTERVRKAVEIVGGGEARITAMNAVLTGTKIAVSTPQGLALNKEN